MWDRKICPEDHQLASQGLRSDDSGPEGRICFSHIPTHTRSSDPYVSSLSEKSVPHRYPCEISVTNTR